MCIFKGLLKLLNQNKVEDMDINDLTIGQAKELAQLFAASKNENVASGLNCMIGKKVIIRTYSAGVWFGTLEQKSGNEVILLNARRMYQWWCKEGISLSDVALYGLNQSKSKIVEAVHSVWLEAIEIIPCNDVSIKDLKEAPNVKAQ